MCFLDCCQLDSFANEYFNDPPVCWVKCNGIHLGKNTILKKFRLSNVLNLGLAGGHDLDSLHF